MEKSTAGISNQMNGSTSEFNNDILNRDHQLAKMAKSTGEKFGEIASDIGNTTAHSIKSSSKYIKENPAKTIAIAASAGVVAGSLLTIAMRSHKN